VEKRQKHGNLAGAVPLETCWIDAPCQYLGPRLVHFEPASTNAMASVRSHTKSTRSSRRSLARD